MTLDDPEAKRVGRSGDARLPVRGAPIARIVRELGPPGRRAQVLLLAHERPDGDAVGSCLALGSILRARGHRARVVLADEVPRRYGFLRGVDRIAAPEEVRPRAPYVAFAIDATDPHRLGAAGGLFEAASRRIVIDHHASNSFFGDVNWVDGRASAVGEMIYGMASSLSWRIPPDAHEALYVAVLTDTGRFSFGNTTAGSLRVAAELVEAGVDPEKVAQRIYSSRSLAEWELEARARSSLRLELGGRVATMELSAEDFRRTGTTPAAANDLASLTRTIEGVELGLFFYEIDGGARTKVGIRTSHAVDANRLAARLGGGGHPQAAGCVIEGRLEFSRRRMLEEAERFLRRRR